MIVPLTACAELPGPDDARETLVEASSTFGEGKVKAARRRGWHNSCGLMDYVCLT